MPDARPLISWSELAPGFRITKVSESVFVIPVFRRAKRVFQGPMLENLPVLDSSSTYSSPISLVCGSADLLISGKSNEQFHYLWALIDALCAWGTPLLASLWFRASCLYNHGTISLMVAESPPLPKPKCSSLNTWPWCPLRRWTHFSFLGESC